MFSEILTVGEDSSRYACLNKFPEIVGDVEEDARVSTLFPKFSQMLNKIDDVNISAAVHHLRNEALYWIWTNNCTLV